MSSYGSIPTTDPDAGAESGSGEGTSSKRKVFIGLAVVLVAVLALKSIFAKPESDHWPNDLYKMGGAIPGIVPILKFPQNVPATTAEAEKYGWNKIDEPCNPYLGEPWVFGGERSIMTSATLYFTPEVGGTPGVVSAIEVDYYGYVEEKLIGVYFSEERTSKDGTYRSVSLALRNSADYDLCDTENPIAAHNPPYLAISPDMANTLIPPTEDSPELPDSWVEGSCIKMMGYHWIQDVESGNKMTYKTENLVPVVPMYSSTDGSINGIFFAATSNKQIWPEGCPTNNPLKLCGVDTNMWDRSPGLLEENYGKFFMCSNFCDTECQFTGTPDGSFTTMHWFFKNVFLEEKCENPEGKKRYCRNGQYAEKLEDVGRTPTTGYTPVP